MAERIYLNPEKPDKTRLAAGELFNRTMANQVEWVEKFNRKPKVADQLNMNVQATLDVDRIVAIAQKSREKDEKAKAEKANVP
jgi:tRNA A37 threonylcarbamoyladenosine biosynthesis protein TsaE